VSTRETFKLEAPERGIEWSLDLGPAGESVTVVGQPGSGQSILAQAMMCTLGGPPQGKSAGLRGLFPSLSWLGEGASAKYTSDITRELRMHPYDENNQPNFMEYESSEERLEYVAYVGGLGNRVFVKNAVNDPTRDKAVRQAFIDYLPQLHIAGTDAGELFDDTVKYINTVLLSPSPSITCLVSMISVAMTAHKIILDMTIPGVTHGRASLYYETVLTIAKRRGVKVILFLTDYDYRLIGKLTDHVCNR